MGRIVDSTPVPVTQSTETWNGYLLEDGTTVKVKQVVAGFCRIHDRFTADGDPIYHCQSQNVMAVDAPEELRKDLEEPEDFRTE